MRFPLQAQVVEGVPLAAPELRVLAERALAADDWATLPLDARAVALMLARPDDTAAWLLEQARTTPLEALELALRLARLTLRFSLRRGVGLTRGSPGDDEQARVRELTRGSPGDDEQARAREPTRGRPGDDAHAGAGELTRGRPDDEHARAGELTRGRPDDEHAWAGELTRGRPDDEHARARELTRGRPGDVAHARAGELTRGRPDDEHARARELTRGGPGAAHAPSSGAALVRVLERAGHQAASQLPAPEFFLALRRALDAAPLLRADAAQLIDTFAPEALLARAPGARVDNLCLRAALAFLLPDDPARWTAAHRKEALQREEPGDVTYLLFGLLRALPEVTTASSWPPPAKLLRGLSDGELEEVTALVRDEALVAQRRRRAELKRAELDVAPLLDAVTEPDALATLCLLTPSAALVEQALGAPPTTDPVTRTLRDSVVHGWARELDPGRGALALPWPEPRKPVELACPAALPFPEPEALKPARVKKEVRELWDTLRGRDDAWPEEVAAVLPLGAVVLPKVREWVRREPALLAATGELEDPGLDEALLLAWTSRRRPLALAVKEFARRHPERAAIAAVRLCFSPLEKERATGVIALRTLERAAAGFMQTLDAPHRAWLELLLSSRAALPAKLPRLPAFVRLAALPPVVSRDGLSELSPAGVEDLVRALKAAPAHDGVALLAYAAPLSAESCAALAGAVFRQWLGAGAPPREKWALAALGHFPSDAWARVLGALSVQWAQGGFPARAQDAVVTLGRMGTREALAQVHHVATKVKTPALRARARDAFEDAAARLGLSAPELEDRLFPELPLPAGAVVSLDGAKVVVSVEGRARPPSDAVKQVNKQLRAAIARLERLMCEGAPLPLVHFTETWGMHPALHAVAERVVWAVLRGPARVGLFVPSSPPRGDLVPPDDDVFVRPVHRLELSEEEVQRVAAWVPGEQPFEQLVRACFPPASLEATLRRQPGRDLPVTALFALERLGWERGRAHDGGLVTDWVRRAEGLSVTLTVEPGLFVGDPLLNDVQHVVDVALESSGPVPPRLASELQRELLGR